tara:strand:+ start:83 stop:754 length:672 start_codon:yes stop_codon:yes gene_type:complete
MKIGDVFKFSNGLVRIFMFDDKEVFYQTVDENYVLIYSKYKTISYYRTSIDYFKKNSSFIKSIDFSEKELEIHRPDLPLKLNCFSGLFWTNKSFEKNTDFLNFLESAGIDESKLSGLESSKIVIYPTSQQQSPKKSILLENKNGSFSGRELLIQCFEIQSDYVKVEKPYFSRFRLIPNGREEKRLSGIGMYRNGIKGNVPSYYLGGEISMMELESQESYIVQK